MVEMKVKKGTNAYMSKFDDESEIIFGRNQKHICTGVRKEGGKIILETLIQ